MEKVSVLAITRNGVKIGRDLAAAFPGWEVHAPSKFKDGGGQVSWYEEPTGEKIASLFAGSGALVCIFSLGAVIRLVAPHMRDKKTDPAVVVIDDAKNFAISALSGHLGGANRLAEDIAKRIGATPVITTAADVNNTIAVDLLGRELGWRIQDDSTITKASAHMVNGDPIGAFQDAGSREWQQSLPNNVTVFGSLGEMAGSGSAAFLIVSDREVPGKHSPKAVIYRPPSLIVGVGLHGDTTKDTIRGGLAECLGEFGLAPMSVAGFASIKKPVDVPGLAELGEEMGVPVQYVERERLAGVKAPNPSETVKALEGTASVSEAAAMLVSGGELVVEKQKFPPNLTIAIARTRG